MGDLTPKLTPEVDSILRHCLETDPEDRFQSARDLAFHLSVAAGTLASGVRRAAGPAGLRPAWRRAIVPVGLAVGMALALAVAYMVGMRAGGVPVPVYQQLTFRRGSVPSARFAPDGHTIVYGGAWDAKPIQLWSTRLESSESRPLDLPDADILAISPLGEMAISIGRRYFLGVGARGTLARLPLDSSAPREILTEVEDADWSPDGSSLAVVHVADGKYRLEFPIGTVLYETTGWINHLRVSPDGTRVAFIDHPAYGDDRGSICVLERTGGGKQMLSDGWASVTGLAWSPARDEIWFTAAEVGARAALHAVDLSGRRRLIMQSANRLEIQDIDRNGRVLLVESRFRLRINAIDLARGGQERDLSWLDGSVVTDLSADGNMMVIDEQSAGGGTPLYAVYIRKTDGSPAIRIGEGSKEADRGIRLWVQDVSEGPPMSLSGEELGMTFSGQPISPDGRQMVAIDQGGRLWLHAVSGDEEPRPIDGLEAGDMPIRWTTDGQSFFVRNGDLPTVVYRFHLSDRRKERVAALSPSDLAGVRRLATVRTTPDGRFFLYTYSQTLGDLFLLTNLR